MLRPVKELYRYMYRADDIILSIPGQSDPIIVPESKLSALTIIKNYDAKIMPVFLITMEVLKKDYQTITTSLSELTVNLSLNKFRINDNKTSTDTTLEFKVNCFRQTFRAMNQDAVNTAVVGRLKEYEVSIPDEKNNPEGTQDTITCKLYLYNAEKLDKLRVMGSYLINGTTNDVLALMFGRRGFNDVLMTPASGSADFKIPYTTLTGGLKCLNNVYGIYSTPYTFFMDTDTTYLLEKNSLGREIHPSEVGTVSMFLEEHGSTEAQSPGCYVDESKIVLNMHSEPIVDYKESDIDYYKYASISGVVSGSSGVSTFNSGGDSALEKVIVVNNQKIIGQEAFIMKDNKRAMNISLGDVDIDIFTPNKKYVMVAHTEYQKYHDLNGDYRLSNLLINMTKQGESGLVSIVTCSFKKA